MISLWPPAYIIYTDDLPEDVGGRASGLLVRIKPKYAGDEGILRHELMHVWQFWMTLGLHGLIKKLSRRYRIWVEASAYKVQMRYPDRHGNYLSLDDAVARMMSPRYNPWWTTDEARKWLT